MSSLVAPRPSPNASHTAPIAARLRRLAESAGSKESFYRGALAAIADHLRATLAQLQIPHATAPIAATICVIERAALVAFGVSLHGLLFVIPVLFRTKLPGKEFGVGLFFALR